MRILRIVGALVGLVAVGCSAPIDRADEVTAPRGAKADDHVSGSCAPDSDSNLCGGQGTGSCYCDASCTDYGDCCGDYAAVCLGEDPVNPGEPTDPTEPTEPTEPTDPMEPTDPVDPGVEPPAGALVPELGTDESREIRLLATAEHGLDAPRDLEFNPQRPDEIWIVNQGDNSMSIIHGWGTEEATIEKRSGPGSDHFLAKPSALAFGAPGALATAQEEDQITQPLTPWDFMGPTLWSDDLDIFDGGHAGHLDMLHNTPNGAGIAWYEGNAYFLFDGEHESITLYDFHSDHGPGGSDHSDGVVRRYVEGQVDYVPGVPSHMEYEGELLYIADTGNGRIAILDPNEGSLGSAIMPNYDGTDQRRVVGGSIETFVDGAAAGLQQPSGLAIHEGRVFVTDHANGNIVAFDMTGVELGRIDTGPSGIMGLTVGPDGRLYFINGAEEQLLRVDP